MDPALTFRPATLADLSIVPSWITNARECELWAGPAVPFPIDPAVLPAAIRFDATNSFSLSKGGSLVGFGQLLAKNADRAHLGRVIVLPSGRQQGHGMVLVSSLINTARERAHQRVTLWVDERNSAASTLYERLGFHDAQVPAGDSICPASRFMELRLGTR